MNEQQLERLSRFLDGDLSPEEEQELRAELETNPTLASELEEMQRLQHAVYTLAAREKPPAELDVLVEPLRRDRVMPRSVRPVYRWLAAAATVVVAVTVGIEIGRQGPVHDPSTLAPATTSAVGTGDDESSGRRGYFRLQPMPRFKEEAEAPQGAAEKLLATPPAFPAPDEAPALEVAGPLPEPPGQEGSATPIEEETGVGAASESVSGNEVERDSDTISGETRERSSRTRALAFDSAVSSAAPSSERVNARYRLEGDRGWLSVELSAVVPPGLYRLLVHVYGERSGMITIIESVPPLSSAARSAIERSLRAVVIADRTETGELSIELEVPERAEP